MGGAGRGEVRGRRKKHLDHVGGLGYSEEGDRKSLKSDAEEGRDLMQDHWLPVTKRKRNEASCPVGQVLANFFRKGPDSKYFRHCGPRGKIMSFM